MIKVRADLTSDERITVASATWFEIDGTELLLYDKNDVAVAAFRQWAYVVVDPPETLDALPLTMMDAVAAIKLPEPRPLNLSPYQLPSA